MSTKIGIIGAGGMLRYHAAGFRSAGAQIVALCDVNQDAARKAADREGITTVFGDVGKMLKECPTLDAVSVIVPNKYHAPLALQALKAGKHVFCEKPPATNARDVRAMIGAAAKSKKTLMFNFNNRARPESQAMMDYIKGGQVGRINSAQAKWIRRTGIPGFGGWFTTKELSGGGPLIDLLHMLDLGLYFMGYPEPDYVAAQTFNDFITDKSFKGPWGIPDVAKGVNDVESACHGFVRFKTGQIISLQISWAEMVKREEVSVAFQGADGLDNTAIDTCELYVQEHGRSVNRSIVVPLDESMGRTASAANFVHSLEHRAAPLNTPDQALTLMRIIDAAYASSRTGRPVKC
jgi:predicted dehydrogenase